LSPSDESVTALYPVRISAQKPKMKNKIERAIILAYNYPFEPY
jgi:hypothetical protein